MFTDQAFVASSKAVSVLCRERNLIGNLVAIYYHLYNLKVDCKQFFQNFRNYRDYRYWPIHLE